MTKNNDISPKTLQEIIESLDQKQEMTPVQERIIQSAAELFAQKGYESSSTSNIASRAGVAEVTLFRNFKSKENLLYQILAPMFIQAASRKYIEPFQGILEEGLEKDPKVVLISAFKDRLEHLTKNQEVLKILMRESHLNEEIKTAIRQNITYPAIESTKEFINENQKRGVFKDFNKETVSNLLFYLLFGYLFMHEILGEDKLVEKEAEQEELIDILLEGLKRSS